MWRCYQVITRNDQQVGPTSLAPLSPYLNDATYYWKQFVNTNKVVAGLAHKKKNQKLKNRQTYLPLLTYQVSMSAPTRWWLN